jgi:hypothetical protein
MVEYLLQDLLLMAERGLGLLFELEGRHDLGGALRDAALEVRVARGQARPRLPEVVDERGVLEAKTRGVPEAPCAVPRDPRHRKTEEDRHCAQRRVHPVALREQPDGDGDERRHGEREKGREESRGGCGGPGGHPPEHEEEDRLQADRPRRIQHPRRRAPRQAIEASTHGEKAAPPPRIVRGRRGPPVGSQEDIARQRERVHRPETRPDRDRPRTSAEHVNQDR